MTVGQAGTAPRYLFEPGGGALSVEAAVRAAVDRINGDLAAWLPAQATPPATLHRAMRYAALSGGKRLRGVVCLAACEACGRQAGGDDPEARAARSVAVAIELVHAYSLVHDDLPAMDNDDWRRGQPTCHRVFGEGMAILAGDALLTLAFEVLATPPPGLAVDPLAPAVRAALVGVIGRAAGSRGMAGGQAADLEAAAKPAETDLAGLEFIHRHKTAALMGAAAVAGGLAAWPVPELEHPRIRALQEYGEALGRAFQILDDLDDRATDGRAPNLAARVGLEAAATAAAAWLERAVGALQPFGARDGVWLERLARQVVWRPPAG